MASTQTWSEYNGTDAATETASRTECNWKNIDNSATDGTGVYSAFPITAGDNSYDKYQCIKFGGTWNSLSAFTYKVDTTNPGTGLTVVGTVVTSGRTPGQGQTPPAASGDSTTNMTTGISANFVSSATPYGTGTASTTAGGTMYVNPFRTQLQTLNTASAGDITSVTITASWTES